MELKVLHKSECRYSGLSIEETYVRHKGVQPDDCCCTELWAGYGSARRSLMETLLTCPRCQSAVFGDLKKHEEWCAKVTPAPPSGLAKASRPPMQGMSHARLQEIKSVVSWDSSPETITMRKWEVM
jgi:hypothetical protein